METCSHSNYNFNGYFFRLMDASSLTETKINFSLTSPLKKQKIRETATPCQKERNVALEFTVKCDALHAISYLALVLW